ncbi:MAG: hypothetical protein WC307_04640 [Candidatus Nanoarchaeia archaeon]|jgi:hypothetical protein
MAVWWELVLQFLLGILNQLGYVLTIQVLNVGVLWQLLPVYTGWFSIQFITKNKEYEDIANRFMNGFTLLWVGFQLGEYVISNLFTDAYIIIKILVVAGIFTYAFFIMRLSFLRKDITKYIARIGTVSAINIAALLLVQDLMVIRSALQFLQIVIAFILFYALLDFLIIKLVEMIYKKVKVPEVEEKPKEPPRYERITTPQPVRPVQPIQRPPVQQPRPYTPPQQPVQQQPPVRQPPINKNY